MAGYFFVNESDARPHIYTDSSLQAYLAQCDGDLRAVQEFLQEEKKRQQQAEQKPH